MLTKERQRMVSALDRSPKTAGARSGCPQTQELLYSKAHLMLSVNSLGDSMNRACMEGWRNNSKGNKSQDVSSEANKAGPATVEFKRQVP